MTVSNLLKLGLKSVLEEAADKAPATLPAEQVTPYLRGAGVTEDEMKFSGVTFPASGKVTRDDLKGAVAKRTDEHGVIEYNRTRGNTSYDHVNLKLPYRGINSTYRERVYTFKQAGEDTVTRSDHFEYAPNYIAHVRGQDDYVDGKTVRVLLELQSDTIANMRTVKDPKTGRIVKKGASVVPRSVIDNPDVLGIINDKSGAKLREALGKEDLSDNYVQELIQAFSEVYTNEGRIATQRAIAEERYSMGSEIAADQPYKKNVYRKLLEREIAQAQSEGITQISIPMSGTPVNGLFRGGNQKLYEESGIIPAEVKKLAKQHGWATETQVRTYPLSPERARDITAYIKDKVANIYGQSQMQINTQFNLLTKSSVEVRSLLSATFDSIASLPSMVDDIVRERPTSFAGLSVPESVKDNAFTVQHFLNTVAKIPGVQTSVAVPKEVQEATRNIQSWYTGIQSELEKGPSVTHIVLNMADATGKVKPPKTAFTLYSSPAAGAFAAYALLSAGANEAKVQKRLQEEGYDKEEIAQYLSDAEVIRVGYENGIPEADIRAYLDKDQVEVADTKTENTQPIAQPGSFWHKESDQEMPDPRLPTTQQQFAKEGQNLQAKRQRDAQLWARDTLAKDELTMSELIGALRVVHPDQSFFTTQLLAIGGNEESARVAQEHAQNAQRHIIAAIKRETGIDAVWSDDADNYVDSEGNVLDDAFWDRMWTDIKNSDQSISWGLTGAAAGAINVAKKTKNPYAIAAGGIVGGYVGSAGGGQIDYIKALVKTGSDMNGQVMARRMLTEAELAALGETAAAAIIGTARVSTGAAKKVIGLIKGKDVDGAMQALAEFTHTTPQELEEIRAGVTRVVAMPDMSREEQTIAATVLTRPGGESVLEAAVSGKPSVGTAVVKSVHQRAKALLTATEALRDTNGAVKITSDLQNYRLDVQRNYEEVKNRAATSTKAGAYKFKFPETVLLPVLERTKGNIFDPTLRKKFVNKVKQVRALSSSRTFADLLEMRKIVNSMVNNSTLKNASGYADIKTALTAIDAEIDRGAAKAVDNPVQWLKDYREANRLYSDMKVLEQNVLYKSLTTPGVTPEAAAKGLYMYATSMDSTFVDVMSKLPRQTRLATEGEIFKIVSDKYTVGVEGGMRATHFPAMAKELSQMTFTSPEARKLQLAVLKLSEVFINDVPLSQVSGSIQIPQFQSYLTADPLTRAKFALASGVFKKIKELTPGELQRNLSLVNILTEVLEKPMDAKLLDQLVKEAGDRVDVSQQVMALASAAARQTADKADIGAPKVKVFGSGKILSTKPVIGSTVEGKSIPMHRIATIEDARDFAAAEGVNPSDVKKVDELLRERGYLAVQLGTNKIRRID